MTESNRTCISQCVRYVNLRRGPPIGTPIRYALPHALHACQHSIIGLCALRPICSGKKNTIVVSSCLVIIGGEYHTLKIHLQSWTNDKVGNYKLNQSDKDRQTNEKLNKNLNWHFVREEIQTDIKGNPN